MWPPLILSADWWLIGFGASGIDDSQLMSIRCCTNISHFFGSLSSVVAILDLKTTNTHSVVQRLFSFWEWTDTPAFKRVCFLDFQLTSLFMLFNSLVL